MPFGDRTDRLVTIHIAHRLNVDEPGWGDTEISYPDFLDFRARIVGRRHRRLPDAQLSC